MKRYFTLDIQAMHDNNLDATQWLLCENIHFLQAISENGYCTKTRAELAKYHQKSLSKIKRDIGYLISKNILKNNSNFHLKTTSIWYKIYSEEDRGQKEPKCQNGGGQKELQKGSKRTEEGVKKNPSTYKTELERTRENTRTKKTFNFSLKKDTHYSRLNDNYKLKLFYKILLIDGGENYDAFVNSLNSKLCYTYGDFSRVYRTWYKRLKQADMKGREIEIDGVKRIEVKYDGKAYAICPVAFDAKIGNIKTVVRDELEKREVPNQFASKLASRSQMNIWNKKEPTYDEILKHQAGSGR